MDTSRNKAMAAVEALFERYRLLAAQREPGHVDFDHAVMNGLKLLDAGPDGSVTYELHIGRDFSNLNNVMHGGAAGVIFDMATTTALCPLARPGFWEFMGGVTRTLSISYLRAVPLGTTVRLESNVMAVGRQMAMIRGQMTSLDGKTVYCTAEHHKVNAPVLAEHAAMRIPWDHVYEREWNDKGIDTRKAKL